MIQNPLVYFPLNDGIGKVELIDWMGGDLAVTNSAKSSFNRVSTEVGEKEKKLIHYLIEHSHTSPLRSTVFTFKVKLPLFLARQFWKHTVASSHIDEQVQFNEQSFRYVEIKEDKAEFYIPQEFRLQSKSNRQATQGNLEEDLNNEARLIFSKQCEDSYKAYKNLIDLGVGREQARGVLVPAIYTSCTTTMSLQALLHFIDLRKGEGAQQEIVKYAEAIEQLIKSIVPVTMEAWNKYHNPPT